MRLYLLRRDPLVVARGECRAKVVRACSELEARAIANQKTGEEGKLWDDVSQATCEVLTDLGPIREVIGDYDAG
jgi:hypothetical protein